MQEHALFGCENFLDVLVMSAVRVKTITFCKLLVKWIDNGTTYFNSIVAQKLNTVMQHLLSTSTGLFSSCKLPLEDIH